jgi:hypothetical protein
LRVKSRVHEQIDLAIPAKQLNWQKQLVQDAVDLADTILVSTPDLLELVPKATLLPVSIDIAELIKTMEANTVKQSIFFKTQKRKILHCPSNPSLKGSILINNCIEELKKEGVEFEYIYGPDLKKATNSTYSVSRYDLFQLYREADIVIDQLLIGWYGQQTLEAMLAECQTICYINPELVNHLSESCPIIQADQHSLKSALKQALNSPFSLDQKTRQHEWVKKVHDINAHESILLKSFGF